MIKRIVKKREGFTLIVTLLGLALMSVFGIVIIGITTSNFKMAKIDSQSQAAYYIAEAGVNKTIEDISKKVDTLSSQRLSHDSFFEKLDDYIHLTRDPNIDTNIEGKLERILDDFKDNFTESPSAEITPTIEKDGVVKTKENYTEKVVTYKITADGEIGNFNRTVVTYIDVTHKIKIDKGHHAAFDYVMYNGGDNTLEIPGNASIMGSVYGSNVKFNESGTIIKKDIVSEGSVNLNHAVTVEGNVYAMGGDVRLSQTGSKVNGDIHAFGDIRLESGADANNLYAGGSVSFGGGNAVDGNINAAEHIDYIVNADGSTNVHNVTVDGNIISGSYVKTKGYRAYKFLGSVHAAGDIENRIGNEIWGDVVSPKTVINDGIIRGEINPIGVTRKEPQPPDVGDNKKVNSVPLTIFNIGTINKARPSWQAFEHIIEPGYYNNLNLKWSDTVEFTGGNYYFNNIDAREGGVKLKLDLSNGPINIYAKGDIIFGSNLKVFVLQKDGAGYEDVEHIYTRDQQEAIDLAGKVYWETHNNFQVPGNCYFLGSILANNNFTSKDNGAATLIGTCLVKEGNIIMDYSARTIYAEPKESAAGSGGGGVDSGEGNNATDQKDRVTIKKPIREQ